MNHANRILWGALLGLVVVLAPLAVAWVLVPVAMDNALLAFAVLAATVCAAEADAQGARSKENTTDERLLGIVTEIKLRLLPVSTAPRKKMFFLKSNVSPAKLSRPWNSRDSVWFLDLPGAFPLADFIYCFSMVSVCAE